MNPVKSKVVKAEEEYEYSSYRNYLDNTKINSKILNLVFNSSESYIKEFQNIKYAPSKKKMLICKKFYRNIVN